MKRNLMPLIAVAFIAALAATGIFYGLLLPRLGKPGASTPTGEVVVTVKPLPRGHTLTAGDLALAPAPASWPRGEGFSERDLATGLTLLQAVGAREPLRRAAVSPRGQAGGVSLAVPAGMRAVTIHPSGSAGIVSLLESGSRIDVHVLDVRQREGGPVLRRLIGDLEVLGKAGDGKQPEVTVVASVGEAERLLLADSALPLRISLRNPSDRAQEGQASVSPAELFNSAPAEPRVRASLQ
jgi:Flp pilus assembly protein CpaB